MSERAIYIPITKELREKIKTLKREKTYDEFLDNIFKNAKGKNSPSVTNPRTTKDGNIK